MRLFTIMLLLVFASLAHGRGNESGGGGDEIRANFIKLGQDVIQFLATDPSGSALAEFNKVDIETLEKTLTIERIEVSDEVLTDRTNSVVDALIRGDRVVLNQSRWIAMLSSKNDIHYLVFHEMLRLSGVNDDNYLISKGLREAMARRNSLPNTTQSVSITCSVQDSIPGLITSQITFAKSHNEAATFLFRLIAQNSTKSGAKSAVRGASRDITRMGTDSFRILAEVGGLTEVINLEFHQSNEMATIDMTGNSNRSAPQIFKCQATLNTLASSNLPADLPLAIEYVADAM